MIMVMFTNYVKYKVLPFGVIEFYNLDLKHASLGLDVNLYNQP